MKPEEVRKIAALARRRHVPIVFVLIPAPNQVDSRMFLEYVRGFNIDTTQIDMTQPTRRLEQSLKGKALEVIDALPAFREAYARGVVLYGKVDNHPSPAGHETLAALLQPGQEAALRAFLTQNQLADLLESYPADWDAPALVAALRPLAPRLYSIASSAREVGDEVHLAAARIDSGGGSKRPGAATHFLSNRPDGAAVPVYVEPNPRFSLNGGLPKIRQKSKRPEDVTSCRIRDQPDQRCSF